MNSEEIKIPLTRTSQQFALRLPDGLRDAIKIEAARHRRSMNSEIILSLEGIYTPETETAGASAKNTPTV